MTLIGIQRRFTEVGRIRLGEKVAKNGRSYPSKLETFRLTSPSVEAMKAVAARYGGAVEKWEDEYQVITESASLDVMLPPFGGVQPYSLSYELWSGGGCQRRCNGEEAVVAQGDQLVESACLCDPDRRDCKPTLRVSFFLPDVTGFGVWRMGSTGYNAAAELPGMLDLLASLSAAGRPMRAVLRLEQRTSKRRGQTRNYAVPVIDLPYSLDQLRAADLPVLGNGSTPQLTATPPVAGPTPVAAAATPVIDEPVGLPAKVAGEAATEGEGASSPAADLDQPYTGDDLTRWLAGTHAAIRERIPAGSDEHAALRQLAATALAGMEPAHHLDTRSLNELTAREWRYVALALRDTPVIPKAADGVALPPAAEGQSVPGTPGTFADSPPAKVDPAPTDPTDVEQAVWKVAIDHGLIAKDVDVAPGWAVLDTKATKVLGVVPPLSETPGPAETAAYVTYWTEFAAMVAAGTFDKAARPRRPAAAAKVSA